MVTYVGATDVRADSQAPAYGRTASGYGGKIPTRYRVRLEGDWRWRRVYAACYGNAASVYIVVRGEDRYLDSDTEHRLESA